MIWWLTGLWALAVIIAALFMACAFGIERERKRCRRIYDQHWPR